MTISKEGPEVCTKCNFATNNLVGCCGANSSTETKITVFNSLTLVTAVYGVERN